MLGTQGLKRAKWISIMMFDSKVPAFTHLLSGFTRDSKLVFLLSSFPIFFVVSVFLVLVYFFNIVYLYMHPSICMCI